MLLSSSRRLLAASFRYSCRFLSTEVESMASPPPEDPKKRRKKDPEDKTMSKEMQTYFDELNKTSTLMKLPLTVLRRKNKLPEIFYIAHEEAAEKIAEVMLKDLDKEQTIFEANPGLGYLTQRLMTGCDNKLILYEPSKSLHSHLEDIIQPSSDRGNIINDIDLSTLWRLALIDRHEKGHRVDDALKGIKRADYESAPNSRLFMATASLLFLKHMIKSVIFQSGLISYGRCEMYFCLPPIIMRHLTCSKEASYMMYRASSVLFQLLFEYEIVGEVNKKHFLPWHSLMKKKGTVKLPNFRKLNKDSMFLMKAVPRADLFRFVSHEQLPAFWYFVYQTMVSRKSRVIPTLERWIPGCGPRLIVNRRTPVPPTLFNPDLDISKLPKFSEPCRTLTNEDFVGSIDIFTEFGDLTPTQILTLFSQFSSWPEYNECAFTASFENQLMKTQLTEDEHVDDLDQPYEEETEIIKE